MARATPAVTADTLYLRGAEPNRSIALGTPEWFAWLAGASTFRFSSPHGSFTACKQRFQRGGWYWKAHRRISGKLRNAYLGKAEALTLERLNEVAARLATQGEDTPREDAMPPGSLEADRYGIPPKSSIAVSSSPEFLSGSDSPNPWDSLLATKLSRPPDRPNLLARPRLIERLNEALRHRLVLVSAPPGFGKTTLLTHWSTRAACPVAWVSLSASDSEPARFWPYIIAALQTVRPCCGREALSLLRSASASGGPHTDAMLTTLINSLAMEHEDLALVMDDYHVINNQAIHSELAFLLDHLPSRIHLVIVTRSDPPLPLARLRGKNQLTELRAPDLGFTLEETATFLNETMRLDLSLADVAILEKHTEGWIGGLHLAALSLRGREDPRRFVESFSGDHRYIFDYLTEEVLRLQPPNVQSFLLQTSILDRLTGPLCEAMTGCRSGQAVLERLEQDNLFTVPLDDQRRWYRYHHLFAEALRALLQREQPDQIPELHRRACEWYADHGLATEGISHALGAGQYVLAADLLERTALMLMRGSEVVAIVEWVRALPDELVRARPRLCLLHGWALAHIGHLEAAEARVRDVERSLGVSLETTTNGAIVGLNDAHVANQQTLADMITVRATIAAYRGEIAAALALSNQARAISPLGEAMTRTVMGNLGLVYLRKGDAGSASQVFAQAGQFAREDGDSETAVAVLCHLAGIQIIEGRLHEAADTYRQALRLVEERGIRMMSWAGAPYRGMGGLLYEWNDLDGATRYVTSCIELTRDDQSKTMVLWGYTTLARVKRAVGDIEGALEVLQRAEQIGRANDSEGRGGSVAANKARLWLMQGNLEAAVRWAETSGLDGDGEIRYQRESEHLTLARVRLAQGKPAEATKLLARLLEAAESVGRQGSVIKILALRSLTLQAEGDTPLALATLRRALTIAQPNGYVRTFVDLGTPMATLLSKLDGLLLKDRRARDSGALIGYVRDLLTAFGSSSTQPRQTPDRRGANVGALSDRELEVLQLIAGGWAPKEIARELVVAESTIRSHIKNIYGKLSAHNRVQAAEHARKLGLVR